MNIQDWFPLGWTSLISLQSKGLSRVLQHHSSKASNLIINKFIFAYSMSEKVVATFVVIYPIIHEVLHISMYMLLRLLLLLSCFSSV